jgi:hypothetical protein
MKVFKQESEKMFQTVLKHYALLLIFISPLILSSCGDSSDKPKVESLTSIHNLTKISETNLQNINCDNVLSVQHDFSQQVVYSWAENQDEKWSTFQLGTSYCESNKNFKKLGMCFTEKKAVNEKYSVKLEKGHFIVSSVLADYKTCTYKSKIKAVVGKVADGEIWSEGSCRYPQQRAARKFLLCGK